MTTTTKGKTNAKKATATKKAPAKKAAVKKPAAKPAAKPVGEAKPIVAPQKGDIVVAFGKHFLVDTSSKKNGELIGKHLSLVEASMGGQNWFRTIEWTKVTAIYKDAGYRG